jgi:CDP-paratose 2-epimerase
MKILITGGAGFIGVNAAEYFRAKGADVIIFDNLSRRGSAENLAWLKSRGGITDVAADLRNVDEISSCLRVHPDVDLILHLAAQVAVTTSVADPREDFEINALGSFNLLEAVRLSGAKPVILYASTNKVYGGMDDAKIIERDGRYAYADFAEGIPECRSLDFHSPYGCSKGAADQYVRDYSRIYGLPTIVFRQSCIYGDHQFGVEDQGWVAWLTIAAILDLPITIYGDGKQTRDVLQVRDLIAAFDLAFQNISQTRGKVYNIGGGPTLQLSLLGLLEILNKKLHKRIVPSFSNWRPGDQRVYVSNIEKARVDFGWFPRESIEAGVERLAEWVRANEASIRSVLSKRTSAQATV